MPNVDTSPAPPRLTRFETLGAWLHLWTPPRDAVVPPIPWRRIGIGAAIAAVLLGALAAWLVPRIDRAKRHEAAAEKRQLAALTAKERRILTRDQRLHTGRATGARPSNPAAAQRALVADLERAITGDARARIAAGTLSGQVLTTSCRPFTRGPTPASTSPTATAAPYECTAVTGDIRSSQRNPAGAIGYPFWARVDFPRGTFLWCKVNLPPGERGIGGEVAVVALPPPCNLVNG
jgi:hypothetical protein